MPYKIDYSPEAQDNLDDLSARNRVIVLTAIDGQLVYEPEKLTRNRKRLKPNKLNLSWELRVDKFRVFYRVEGKIVTVDLIGEKVGNRVYVGREILEL